MLWGRLMRSCTEVKAGGVALLQTVKEHLSSTRQSVPFKTLEYSHVFMLRNNQRILTC